MSVSIIVNLSNTSREAVESYLWAGVTVSDMVVSSPRGQFLMLDAPDTATAESQRDRLGSGMIGARIVLSDSDWQDFIS